MRIRRPARALAAAAPLALALVLAAAPQASAGILDGSANNLEVLDHISALSTIINSDADFNDNANRRNRGNGDEPFAGAMRDAGPPAECEATVTATDPDGATGTATTALPTGQASTELDIPDTAPGTAWGHGDTDHLAGQIVCSDARTGAVLGMVSIDVDRTAH